MSTVQTKITTLFKTTLIASLVSVASAQTVKFDGVAIPGNLGYTAASEGSYANFEATIRPKNGAPAVTQFFGPSSTGPGASDVLTFSISENSMRGNLVRGKTFSSVMNVDDFAKLTGVGSVSNTLPPSVSYNLGSSAPAYLYVEDSNGYHYMLIGSPLGAGNVDLVIFSTPGPDLGATQESLEVLAKLFKAPFALQNAATSNGLKYDCTEFDWSGLCISLGGTYHRTSQTHFSDVNSSAAGFILVSKLINATSRIGGWVSQDGMTKPGEGVNVFTKSATPNFGAYGVWNAYQSGLGPELRLAAAYGQQRLDITRPQIQPPGTYWSTEPGHGVSDFRALGLLSQASYNIKLSRNALLSPYVGAKYTSLSLGGYKEDAGIDAPLSYKSLYDQNIIGVLGVKLTAKLSSSIGVALHVGHETDLTRKTDKLRATGIDGLTPVAFNPDRKTSRADYGLGLWVETGRSSRIMLQAVKQEQPYANITTTTGMLTYSIGY